MNAGIRYLIGFNGYPLSAGLALLFHMLVLGFILYWNNNSDSSEFELVQPTVIKALFIDENPQLQERQRLERQRVLRQREEEQRREQEQQRQQQEKEEQRRREEERQRQAEAERLRQQQLEQRRQQELREQAERQRLEEQRRREELARQEELNQQDLRRRQEEAERTRLAEEAAAAAARTEFEVVQSGMALIRQFVEEAWNRPPSARNGMRAVLRISMLPTGEVTDVAITESSGDPPFDRAARNAVYSAQPFNELQQMPINIFNANFRTLSLIFEPEDLLN